jgi:hypothetical protein
MKWEARMVLLHYVLFCHLHEYISETAVFWDVLPCSLVGHQHFGGTYCFHLHS